MSYLLQQIVDYLARVGVVAFCKQYYLNYLTIMPLLNHLAMRVPNTLVVDKKLCKYSMKTRSLAPAPTESICGFKSPMNDQH